MNSIHRSGRIRPWTAAFYTICTALLAACQVFGFGSTIQQQPVTAPLPTRTARPLEPLPATFTPTPLLPTYTPTTAPDLPELLADFPLFDGARLDPAGTVTGPNKAQMILQTSKSPGELAVFYRKALEGAGWTKRYSEGNAVGGFVQEWKKDSTFLTIEYYFQDGRPVLSADLRVIDSKQALSLLLGFPLPNGAEVTRKEGSTIELYVPQELAATIDDFKAQINALYWRIETIKPTGWCGSRACQGTVIDEYRQLATLEPLPTPDSRKTEYYRVTMPDRTLAEITFLPHGSDTRVFINVNFKDIVRSGMPVPAYPRSTITGVMPGVAMFEVKADIKDVIKYYEDGLAWLGWEALEFKVQTPDMYTRSWRKDPHRVISLSLTTVKGIVYAQLTCVVCADPYFVMPTITPTAAPSK